MDLRRLCAALPRRGGARGEAPAAVAVLVAVEAAKTVEVGRNLSKPRRAPSCGRGWETLAAHGVSSPSSDPLLSSGSLVRSQYGSCEKSRTAVHISGRTAAGDFTVLVDLSGARVRMTAHERAFHLGAAWPSRRPTAPGASLSSDVGPRAERAARAAGIPWPATEPKREGGDVCGFCAGT
jgi:hypothetical protein